jgi:hypothetical protein
MHVGSQSIRHFAYFLARHKLVTTVFIAAIALAISWPSQSMASTDFDLQAAIDSCPAGGTVSIPAGTYEITNQVLLKSGVSLKGAGVDATVLHMATQSEFTNLLVGRSVSNLSISDLTLASPAAAGRVFAIHISTYANVTIERVKVTGCMYVLKADTQGSNLTVRNLTARECGQMYVSNLTGGSFDNLDLQMTQVGLDDSWHAIYLCANNHHLRFNNVTASGSKSWTVQLWTDYEWDQPSDDIVFDGLYTIGRPLVISSGYYNVTFKNLTAISTESSYECVRICDPYNVTIDGFTGSGGPVFFSRYTGYTTHDIALRNGAYSGGTLVSDQGSWISNLVVENVNLNGAPTTTTTAAPATTTSSTTTTSTTTTTVVPTTTTTSTSTTIAPTTTTTAAPTATTTPAAGTSSSNVTITSPADGSTVAKGTVAVKVSATTSTRVGSVYFYVDGVQRSRDSRAPYAYNWRTSGLASGSSHVVKAVAYSSAGVVLGTGSSTYTIAGTSTSTSPTTTPSTNSTTTTTVRSTTTTTSSPWLTFYYRWFW